DIIVPFFASELESETRKLIEEGLLKSDFLKRHGTDVHKLEAEKIFNIGLEVTDNTSPIFITSFCRHAEGSNEWNNGLLSQWRAYGPHGGCAIEFDEQELANRVSCEAAIGAYTHISISNVQYKNHASAVDTKQIGEFAAVIARKLVDKSPLVKERYK